MAETQSPSSIPCPPAQICLNSTSGSSLKVPVINYNHVKPLSILLGDGQFFFSKLS